MPLSDFLLGKDFPKMEPFVQALQQGMDNELVSLKKEITELKQEIVQLKTLIDAQAVATSPPPPVTVTVTPPVTEGTPTTTPVPETPPVTEGTTTSVGGTPTTTPTPETMSTTTRVADQLVLALADPFLIDQPVAVIIGGGTYAIGDTVTLQTTNIRSDYSFSGWYNSTGEQVSADPTYTFTVASGGGSFTARFVAVSQVTTSTTTNTSGGGGGGTGGSNTFFNDTALT